MKASGVNECGGVSPCSGMAFTITYQAVGSTPSTPLFFPSAPPCFVSSVSSPANVCVLVASYPDGATLPENIQGATITVSTSPSSSATNIYDASTGAPWSGTEATGASSYDTSSVTGVAGVTPTGSVTYTFFTTGDCSGVGTSESPPGGSLLSDGLVPNSLSVGPLAAGSYSFLVNYFGDNNYWGSNSVCETFTVNKAPTTTTIGLTETVGSGADSVSWTVPPSGGLTLGAILRVSSTVGTQSDGFSFPG